MHQWHVMWRHKKKRKSYLNIRTNKAYLPFGIKNKEKKNKIKIPR